jgi:hypothetical protein
MIDLFFSHITCVLGIPFEIGGGIQVMPTPGHTADDVSVVVKTEDLGTVVIAGKMSCRLGLYLINVNYIRLYSILIIK